MLREVIENQKIELRQVGEVIAGIKDSREEALREKERYQNEIKNVSFEKEKELFMMKA